MDVEKFKFKEISMSVNHFTLQGRFTADPVSRQTASGKNVSNFTIAWSEKFGQTENKLFMRCTAWEKTADNICKFFKKGSPIVVEGGLKSRDYTNKEGQKVQTTEMDVRTFHFEPKNEGTNNNQSQPQQQSSAQPDEMQGDPMNEQMPWEDR